MFILLLRIVLLGLLLAISPLITAQNIAKNTAEDFQRKHQVWLDSEKQYFALYQRHRQGRSQGSVVLITHPSQYPNNSKLLTSLFNYLPKYHWNTLLISLPADPIIPHHPSITKENQQQWQQLLKQRQQWIDLAIQYARKRDRKQLVIAAEQ